MSTEHDHIRKRASCNDLKMQHTGIYMIKKKYTFRCDFEVSIHYSVQTGIQYLTFKKKNRNCLIVKGINQISIMLTFLFVASVV